MKKKVLIIEDEVKLARFIELELKHEGYEVDVANDGAKGYDMFMDGNYNMVLLDLMLPHLSGIEVCRRIRKSDETPIIMLTAKDEIADKVSGLDCGADDYMTKPFAIEELLARMRASLKRLDKSDAITDIIEHKTLTVDMSSRSVKVCDNAVELTKREYDLLIYLLLNKNAVLSREQLVSAVWGYDYLGETNVVDVYIRYLRSKIDEKYDVKIIHTIRGVGYAVKDES